VYFDDEAAEALGVDAYCSSGDSCTRTVGLGFRDGVDPAEVAERYTNDDLDVKVNLPSPPSEIERLMAVEDLPRYLALFLAALAAAAVSFATATTVRRRRSDLAVLRVLGMTRRQLRTVIAIVVLALTLGGAIAGGTLGVIAGLQVWRAVAASVSMPFSPSVPLAALLLVPLGALVLGQVVATLARRAAGTTAAALVLRAE
jgi:predicted lysophospholipase L1 biosynthesis ABC-type transport system permease subunit